MTKKIVFSIMFLVSFCVAGSVFADDIIIQKNESVRGAGATGGIANGGIFFNAGKAGGSGIDHTPGYGPYMIHNAYWSDEAEEWIQPRGTMYSQLFNITHHYDIYWWRADRTGENGSPINWSLSMIIKKNNGNVGIGTMPTEKLSVAGVIESEEGGIKFPDGTIQTTAATVSSVSIIDAGYDALTIGGDYTAEIETNLNNPTIIELNLHHGDLWSKAKWVDTDPVDGFGVVTITYKRYDGSTGIFMNGHTRKIGRLQFGASEAQDFTVYQVIEQQIVITKGETYGDPALNSIIDFTWSAQ